MDFVYIAQLKLHIGFKITNPIPFLYIFTCMQLLAPMRKIRGTVLLLTILIIQSVINCKLKFRYYYQVHKKRP